MTAKATFLIHLQFQCVYTHNMSDIEKLWYNTLCHSDFQKSQKFFKFLVQSSPTAWWLIPMVRWISATTSCLQLEILVGSVQSVSGGEPG
jgi:hypothetical protein